MIDVIVTILVLYLIYKIVFDFVVPVAKTTSHFKSQVSEMQRMQEEMRKRQQQQASQQQNYSRANQANTKKDTTTTDGEYIDFEEIK